MTALRLVSWNVENLAPALGIEPRKIVRGYAARRRTHLSEMVSQFGEPDILCLQEVRIRPVDAAHVDSMASALPGFVCHHALCADAQNGKFRGGRAYGVATYLRDSLAAVPVPRPDWDLEGRVVASVLPALSLLIVNVYAVNGSDKPHFDHARGAVYEDRHAFKRRFQADLIAYVRRVREDRDLVLMGDWNVSRSALDTWPRLRRELPHALARTMFNDTLMPALDVVDAFRALHPDARAYTWFNRMARPGSLDAARVDFALVSRGILSCVRSATILDEPLQRFHSDHAPVELTISRPKV